MAASARPLRCTMTPGAMSPSLFSLGVSEDVDPTNHPARPATVPCTVSQLLWVWPRAFQSFERVVRGLSVIM